MPYYVRTAANNTELQPYTVRASCSILTSGNTSVQVKMSWEIYFQLSGEALGQLTVISAHAY